MLIYSIPMQLALLSFVVFASIPFSAQARDEVFELVRKSSDSREIAGGAVRIYEVKLRANDYLRVLINKGDLSLKATLLNGTGVRVAEFASRRYGPRHISFTPPATGLYRLELLSLETDPTVRQYDLRVDEIHQANARDRKNALADWSYADAERLRTEWSEHSLRAAIEKYLTAARLWQSISDHPRALEALEALGETHFILGEYALSLRSYKSALKVSHTINRESAVSALNGIAYVYIYLGDNPNAPTLIATGRGFGYRLVRPST